MINDNLMKIDVLKKTDIFRTIEFWKSSFISMPDNSFFELLRSIFGKIKTPFNKQHLLNDLEIFLMREDIQKTISSYIDINDIKIISAVALFGEPVMNQLERFFSNEYSYAQLQDIIVNLEERFILYRFTDPDTIAKKTPSAGSYGAKRNNLQNSNKSGCYRLALNPVLKTVLVPYIADTSFLFPSVPSEKAKKRKSTQENQILIDDLIIAGILSFASQWEKFYKPDSANSISVIRKQVLEAAKICFPGIELTQVLGSLLVLGLFYIEADMLLPDKKHFDNFSMLKTRERCEYYAAAFLIYNETASHKQSDEDSQDRTQQHAARIPHCSILPPLFKNRIRETAIFIHCLTDSLETEAQYSEKTLFRMIEVIKSQTGLNIIAAKIIDAMKLTGLIENTGEGIIQLGKSAGKKQQSNGKSVVAIDSGFSILVYPEIEFFDAICLASFLNIKEKSSQFPVGRFELNRDSAVRAFDKNITADEIIELLNRLSEKKADDNMIWNLKDWEKRHGEVSLKKGVILSLSEEHRYLIETKPLAAIINETLAPGLYLLDENAIEDAAAALRSAGIDIIARRKHKTDKHKFDNSRTSSLFSPDYFPAPKAQIIINSKLNIHDLLPDTKLHHASIQNGKFKVILKEMALSEQEKMELSARIDRRLILCETQLKEASLRYEKLEARHMDYVGKQNIAKQAIAQHSPVEIIWSQPHGAMRGAEKADITDGEKIFGIPKALEKEENELFLVIDTMNEQDFRIPLAKISLLRRIKKSIFEI